MEQFLAEIPGSQFFLRDVINVFERASLPYCLVGSLARKCWLDHQEATKDADILITDEYGQNFREALKLLPEARKFSPFPNMTTLERDGCPMKIDIMIATAGFDPEESCVHDCVDIFFEADGFKLKLAKPEYLAWMLASSPHERHRRDLLRLLISKTFSTKRLMAFMRHAEDMDGLKKIENIIHNKEAYCPHTL